MPNQAFKIDNGNEQQQIKIDLEQQLFFKIPTSFISGEGGRK